MFIAYSLVCILLVFTVFLKMPLLPAVLSLHLGLVIQGITLFVFIINVLIVHIDVKRRCSFQHMLIPGSDIKRAFCKTSIS